MIQILYIGRVLKIGRDLEFLYTRYERISVDISVSSESIANNSVVVIVSMSICLL